MANSPILQIPQVAPNQANKETTINDGVSILERSLNDVRTVDLTAGNATLNLTDYTRFMLLRCTGHTVARVLNVPGSKRLFAVHNQGSGNVTVEPPSGTDVVVPPGSFVVMFNDGTDIVKISDSAASGSVTAFLDLPDTPGSYSGAGGQALVVKGTEDGLEFGTIAVSFVQLTDTPANYSGAAGRFVQVNPGANGLQFRILQFSDISDVPNTFAGQAGKVVFVNDAEDGLVYLNLPEPVVRVPVPITGDNMGFEDGDLTDWTVVAGTDWLVGTTWDTITASEGTNFAYHDVGGSDPVALSRQFDLTAFADAENIDEGSEITVTAAFATLGADTGQITVNFIDEDELTIDTVSSSSFTASDVWVDRTLRSPVPFGTRKIEVVLSSVNSLDEEDLDTAFAFDDLRVTLRIPIEQIAEFTDLLDVPNDYTGQSGKTVKVNQDEDGLEFVVDTFDIAMFFASLPEASELLARVVVTRAFTLPTGLTLSRSTSAAAATASAQFSLQKNGSEFGTIDYSASGVTGVFTAASPTSFVAGDVLTVIAPSAQDDTLSDISVTLVATR